MSSKDVTSLLVLLGLLDVPLLLATRYLRQHLPPRPNWWCGYRTTRALRSLPAWQAANAYSFRLLYRSLWGLPLVQAGAVALGGGVAGALASVGFVLVQGGTILFCTERLLRRRFDE